MYEVWKSERARVEACVNEWSKRRAKRADIGPGLLVRMVRDGDDPAANGRRPRRAPSLPCPECEVGGGQHAADCPTLARAGS
jgi:hypothetical protein